MDKQNALLDKVKSILKDYGQGDNHVGRVLGKAAKFAGKDVSPTVSKLCDEYTVMLDSVKAKVKDIKSATFSKVEILDKEIHNLEARLQVIRLELSTEVATFKESRGTDSKARLDRARQERSARDMALKVFKDSTCPKGLLRYLHDSNTLDAHGAITDSNFARFSKLRSHTKLLVPAKESTEGSITVDDHGSVKEVSFHGVGEHGWMECIPRLIDAVGTVSSMVERADAALSRTYPRADARISVSGGGADTVESNAWLPKAFSEGGWMPEAARSYGAPWLLSTDGTGFRGSASGMPL